jgi:hypothetical protein
MVVEWWWNSCSMVVEGEYKVEDIRQFSIKEY